MCGGFAYVFLLPAFARAKELSKLKEEQLKKWNLVKQQLDRLVKQDTQLSNQTQQNISVLTQLLEENCQQLVIAASNADQTLLKPKPAECLQIEDFSQETEHEGPEDSARSLSNGYAAQATQPKANAKKERIEIPISSENTQQNTVKLSTAQPQQAASSN